MYAWAVGGNLSIYSGRCKHAAAPGLPVHVGCWSMQGATFPVLVVFGARCLDYLHAGFEDSCYSMLCICWAAVGTALCMPLEGAT